MSLTTLLTGIAASFLCIAPAFSQQLSDGTDTEGEPSEPATVVVTGKRASAYAAAKASAGTKFPAALRDIPQSIQVVTRAVIDDQSAFRPHDLVQNVSGVYRGNAVFGDNFIFRGFSTSEFLRDGYPDRRGSMRDTAHIEQVEVLKGPASVLYGRLQPGGTINYITKRPLDAPRYTFDLKTDSDGTTRAAADLSTVAGKGRFGLRVNGAHESGSGFRDHSFSDRDFGAAVLTWRLSKDTRLGIELETLNDRRLLDRGVPRYGTAPAPIPVTRLISEPNDDRAVDERLAGYTLEHDFNDGWQLRHALRYSKSFNKDHRTRFLQSAAQIAGDPQWDGTVNRDLLLRDSDDDQLTAQVELIGALQLGGMRHQLLIGLDADRYRSRQDSHQANTIVESNSINIYAPVYGHFVPVGLRQSGLSDSEIRANALYVQDLVELSPRWKALVGARFDDTRSTSDDLLRDTSAAADQGALSPRAGLVWQPGGSLSLYASYSESFIPVIGEDYTGALFDPEAGRQLEAGAKAQWLDGRLAATAAVFEITKDNIAVEDPLNDGFSIQTGEVTSDGVEIDLSGSPLPGLNLTANLALIDARITEDTRENVLGKRPSNTPSRGGGAWASYELQNDWRGWGGGLGMHYVGRRQGDDIGSFFLPSYTRWDVGLWYRASQWRLSLKVDNLFDATYYISSHDTLGIYPGAPRNYTVSASYQF